MSEIGCQDCGLPYSDDKWTDACIPDAAWERIMPSSGGGSLLCFNCMVQRLNSVGLRDVPVYIGSGPMRQPNIDEAFERGWHTGYKAKQNEIECPEIFGKVGP